MRNRGIDGECQVWQHEQAKYQRRKKILIKVFIKPRYFKNMNVGENKKTQKNDQVIQWPYAEYLPDVKFPYRHRSCSMFFTHQKIRDKESAQHKKEIYAQPSKIKNEGLDPSLMFTAYLGVLPQAFHPC